jgi:two-component system cell cycle sensor histidine kinase/response regulator CckA
MDTPEQKKEDVGGIEELHHRILELEAEILRLKLSPKEKETAGALENQETLVRLLIENTEDVIFTLDLNLQTTYVSSSVEKILGYSPEKRMRQRLDEQLRPESVKLAVQMLALELEREEDPSTAPDRSVTLELENVHRDGSTRIMETVFRGLRDREGKLVGIYGLSRDISTRKRIEEALRESEERYRDLVENSQDLICTHDLKGKLLSVSGAPVRFLGYSRESLLKMNLADLLVPEMRDRFGAYLAEIQSQGRSSGIMRIQTAGGETRFWEYNNTLRTEDVAVPIVRGLARDITERQMAEMALRRSETSLQAILRSTADGILAVSTENRVLFANERFVEMWRIPPGLIEGGDNSALLQYVLDHLTDPQGFLQKVREVYASKEDSFDILDFKDGREVERLSRPLLQGGKLRGRVWSFRDISERKRKEEALKQSEDNYRRLFEESKRAEELYRLLLNSSADAIAIYDLEGSVRFINPSFTRTFGWTLEELVGRRIPFVPDSEKEKSIFEIRRGLSGGPPVIFETKRITKDGRTLDITLSGSRYDDHEGAPAGILSIFHDITQTRVLEAQFRQAQKMEAIGTLAGGIAHDFNNLLQVIGGYAQLLLWGKSELDPGHNELVEIQKAVQRAAQLIRQLLTFSRKVEGKHRFLDLNQEILEAEKVLQRTIPKMVALDFHLESRLETVNADPVQIEQILLNLGSNAADAMPKGGRLILETRSVCLDEEFCRHHLGARPGNYVLLTVADTGQGMDRETVQHIFEPFFTTKEIGKGTGLGLASVYGIVKSHGGYILCESEPGQGTIFKIYLPAVQEKEAQVEKGLEEAPLKGGSETILMVDDEASVRELAVQILQRYGYQVLAADCGEAALETFQTRPDGIDLVILDLGMPGMGGFNCLRGLLKIDVSVRVLIASGYSVDGSVQECLKSGAAGYIGKPYRLKDLLAKVRTVLDGA